MSDRARSSHQSPRRRIAGRLASLTITAVLGGVCLTAVPVAVAAADTDGTATSAAPVTTVSAPVGVSPDADSWSAPAPDADSWSAPAPDSAATPTVSPDADSWSAVPAAPVVRAGRFSPDADSWS